MLGGGFEEGVHYKYCGEALKALVTPVHLLGIKWHLPFKNLLYRSLPFYFSQENKNNGNLSVVSSQPTTYRRCASFNHFNIFGNNIPY